MGTQAFFSENFNSQVLFRGAPPEHSPFFWGGTKKPFQSEMPRLNRRNIGAIIV
jgi:hypothetical protein